MRRALLFCLLAGCVLAADLFSSRGLPEGRWATPPAAAATVRAVALADTLSLAVPAGETLIADLPDSVGGRAVTAYRIVRAPALSWATGRQMFWQTRPEDIGQHRLVYEARFQTDPPDTVAVLVTVE